MRRMMEGRVLMGHTGFDRWAAGEIVLRARLDTRLDVDSRLHRG